VRRIDHLAHRVVDQGLPITKTYARSGQKL
jgi:hypothetical protein